MLMETQLTIPDFLQSQMGRNFCFSFCQFRQICLQEGRPASRGMQKVLEIELSQADKTRQVAESLESVFQNPLTFKLYNVDVLPEQTYFYEKNIFPLGFVQVETSGDQITQWELQDDVESVDYKIPDLRVLALDIAISSKVPRFDSRLVGISLQDSNGFDKIRGTRRDRNNRKSAK